MFNIENLNDEYFANLDSEAVLDIKSLSAFEKNQCLKYFLNSKVLTNKSILYNLFLIISSVENIDEDDYAREDVFFTSKEEYEDLESRLGYEIIEFRINLLELYLCIMAGLANTSEDSKVEIEPTYLNILEYVDPIFIANLILSYIKSVNAEHIQPVKNAKELYDKINYMKGVESCGFDDIGIV